MGRPYEGRGRRIRGRKPLRPSVLLQTNRASARSLPLASAWIELGCEPCWLACVLADEVVGLFAGDDGLDACVFVTWRHRELRRVRAHLLVLVTRHSNACYARAVAALADQVEGVQIEAPANILNLLVHLAKNRLIQA